MKSVRNHGVCDLTKSYGSERLNFNCVFDFSIRLGYRCAPKRYLNVKIIFYDKEGMDWICLLAVVVFCCWTVAIIKRPVKPLLTCERQADGHVGQEPVGRVPDERQGQRRRYGQPGAGRQGEPAVRGDPQQAFLPGARHVRRPVAAVFGVSVVRTGNIVLEPHQQ